MKQWTVNTSFSCHDFIEQKQKKTDSFFHVLSARWKTMMKEKNWNLTLYQASTRQLWDCEYKRTSEIIVEWRWKREKTSDNYKTNYFDHKKIIIREHYLKLFISSLLKQKAGVKAREHVALCRVPWWKIICSRG